MPTNHNNPRAETLCSESNKANFTSDSGQRLALVRSFTKLRDEWIGGMRDYGANDTSEVTGSEGHTELSGFVVGLLGLSEDVSVEELHDLFEEEEFGHSVRDLLRVNDKHG